MRNIKEAMYFRANNPSLNRNLGKYKLPHVWDQILQDTPALTPKQQHNPPLTPLLDTYTLTANHSGGHNHLLGKYSM